MSGGSLTVVGTGIKSGWHTTEEARRSMEQAEHLLFVVNDALSAAWIRKFNAGAENLADHYREGRSRHEAYAAMVEQILERVREGREVCAAFYGHPGVFVRPSREALRRARAEGFPARMLPGVSAEDCLFADLEIEPAATGVQRFEATDFLLYPRRFDPRSSLILWQIGAIGQIEYKEAGYDRAGLRVLTERLSRCYADDHPVVLYEAATLPIHDPIRTRIPLAELPRAETTPRTTLFIPPLEPEPPDPEMVRRLGLEEHFEGLDVPTIRRATGLDPA